MKNIPAAFVHVSTSKLALSSLMFGIIEFSEARWIRRALSQNKSLFFTFVSAEEVVTLRKGLSRARVVSSVIHQSSFFDQKK